MIPAATNSSPSQVSAARAVPGLWLPIALSLLPIVLLRPWEFPLPAIDFATNVSATIGSSSLWEAFERLSDMVRTAGRHHPLWTFLLAARWWWFGENAVLWHLPQIAAVMAVIVVVWMQLQGAGASRLALVVGVGCAAVGGSVFSSLEAPEVAEPLGLLFLLGSVSLASRVPARGASPLRTAAISATAAAAVLTKETFVIGIPAVLLTAALSMRHSGAAPRQMLRPLAALAIALTLTTGLLGIGPALRNRLNAPPAATGAQYSAAAITPARAQNVVAAMWLPVTRNPVFPANVIFVVLGAAAVGLGLRKPPERVYQVAVFAILPVFGTLLYLPWPAFPGYYALISVPLQAAVVALAVDLARMRRGAVRAAAIALVAVFVAFTALIAVNRAAMMRADGRLENRLVDLVRTAAEQGVTLVADHYPTYYSASVGKFATIRHPDRAARVRGVDCSQTGAACGILEQQPGPYLVFPDSSCAAACTRPAGRPISECATTYDYRTLRPSERCRTAMLIAAD